MKLCLLALVVAGCGGGMSSESATDVQDATRLTAASYAHQDAGTAGAALIRQAHCSLQAVIRNEKLSPVDAGIPCN